MDASVILSGLLIVGVVYIIIAAIAVRNRHVEGSWSFASLLFATAIYAIGYYFMLQSNSVDEAYSWIRFQYLGVVCLPALWLLFIIQYCGWSTWLTPVRVIGIWAIPVATILIVNSTFVDYIFQTNIQLRNIIGLTTVSFDFKFGYYIFLIYTYVAILVGNIMLIYRYISFKEDPNSNRYLLIVLASVAPWIASIIYTSRINPYDLDFTPLSMLITAIIYLFNMYYFNMFRSGSITKGVIFEVLKDAIIVTNEQNRIINTNSMTSQYFGNKNELVGKPISIVIDRISEDGFYDMGNGNIWLDVQCSLLDKSPKGNHGQIYIFRDITAQVETQLALAKSEEKYRTLFDHMQEGFALHEIICDEEGRPIDYRFLDVNKAFERITGLRQEDLINRRVMDVLPQTEPYWIENYGKVALEGESITFENYSVVVDKYFTVTAFMPKKGQFAVIFFDVTDRILFEKATQEEKERLRTTLLSVGDGVIVTDKDANVIMINNLAQKMTGYSETEAQGRYFADVFQVIDGETGEICKNPVKLVFQTGKVENLEAQTVLVAKDGTRIQVANSAAPIKDEEGNIRGVVVVFRDVTEEQKRQQQISYLSYHDQLTGLYNRRYFEEQLTRLNTTRNLPLSIIIIDVNGLKLVNDAFGHVVGDQLIQKSAEVIRKACRTDEIIARWGGDEFVVLLPKTTSEQTQEIVNRINVYVKEADFEPAILSIAIGWSTKTSDIEEIQETFKKAEDHMYRRKLLDSPKVKRGMVEAVINQLHTINNKEKSHAERVSALCAVIATKMGLSKRDVNELKTTALLHDIGKVAINPQIINKSESLNEEEWLEIKRHPETGYRIFSSVNEMSDMAEIVLAHHEHWDGTGYPQGIKGEKIPLLARILFVAEAFDSMTNDSCYRKALSKEEAIIELQEQAGKQFDPAIVEVLIKSINTK